MNQRQENYYHMVKSTLAFMESEKTKWETKLPVNETVTKISGQLDTLDTIDVTREELKTTGLTKDKSVLFDKMCTQTYKLACKVKAYAKRIGNNTILVAVDYSETGLRIGTEKEVVTRCINILKIAQDNIEALAPYEVTQEELSTLDGSITEFKPKTPDRDLVGDQHEAKTSKINATISDIRIQIDILDDLVEGLFDDDFIELYKIARQIIDR